VLEILSIGLKTIVTGQTPLTKNKSVIFHGLHIELFMTGPASFYFELSHCLFMTTETGHSCPTFIPLMCSEGKANFLVEKSDGIVLRDVGLRTLMIGMATAAGYGCVQFVM
jgi:hypothetical protein